MRKVILLFADQDDGIATNVKRQLVSYGETVLQVDKNNPISFSQFTINNDTEKLSLQYKNKVFCSTMIKSIWFRRGYFSKIKPING